MLLEILKRLIKKVWPKIRVVAIWDGFRFMAFKYIFINRIYKGIPSPKKEAGVIYGINNFVQLGMTALQIGGGNGLTSLYTLRRIGDDGFLTIIEPGNEQVSKVKSALSLNNYKNYQVEHKFVGNSKNAWSFIDGAQVLNYKDLPDCDYLEVDCEGCEKDLIEKMIIRPNIIIIEIHNNLLGQDNKWLYNFMEDNNYSVLYYSGHDAKIISEDIFNKLSSKSIEENLTTVYHFGTRSPVVIGIKKN